MPKSIPPTEETRPETVDAPVVSLKSQAQVSKALTGRQRSDDRAPLKDDQGSGAILGPTDASSAERSESSSPATSERWAAAILSLMHVERSRFQDRPIDIPRVHIASLEAIGRPRTASSDSAHSSITLRKPRQVQPMTAQEAPKIHTLPSLTKPKP